MLESTVLPAPSALHSKHQKKVINKMYERHGTHLSSQGFYLKKNPEETTFFEKQTGFHDIFFAAGTSEP